MAQALAMVIGKVDSTASREHTSPTCWSQDNQYPYMEAQ